jgi:hypothetical protein
MRKTSDVERANAVQCGRLLQRRTACLSIAGGGGWQCRPTRADGAVHGGHIAGA